MAIMSMKMLAALEAAKAAGPLGLRDTAVGWVADGRPTITHPGPTVSALVERGDLSKQRNLRTGARCFITQRGEQSLVEALRGAQGAMR